MSDNGGLKEAEGEERTARLCHKTLFGFGFDDIHTRWLNFKIT